MENRNNHFASLQEKFKLRNYPTDLIEKQFERAKQKDRTSLIFEKRKHKKKNNGTVYFIFTYNTTNPPLHMWLRDCRRQLEISDEAKAIGNRIQISFKQSRNLQKIAGGCRSKLGRGTTPPLGPGCFKCGNCRVLCPKINETKFSPVQQLKKHTQSDKVLIARVIGLFILPEVQRAVCRKEYFESETF